MYVFIYISIGWRFAKWLRREPYSINHNCCALLMWTLFVECFGKWMVTTGQTPADIYPNSEFAYLSKCSIQNQSLLHLDACVYSKAAASVKEIMRSFKVQKDGPAYVICCLRRNGDHQFIFSFSSLLLIAATPSVPFFELPANQFAEKLLSASLLRRL